MQYMLLIYQDEKIYGPNKADSPLLREVVAKHRALAQDLGAIRIGGAGLKGVAAATTVRHEDGRHTIHDGPFAETKEQLGGFYLINVPDLDAAIAIAKRVPMAEGGSVEIRPLLTADQG